MTITGQGKILDLSSGLGHVPDAATVSEIVAAYERVGFPFSFRALENGRVRCGACRTASDAAEVTVCALARTEGPSDPADMAMVAAVCCPWCSMAGVLVLGFGAGASVEDADVLRKLQDVRPADGTAVMPASQPSSRPLVG